MNALVTGGTGTVGRRCVARLVRAGHTVRVIGLDENLKIDGAGNASLRSGHSAKKTAPVATRCRTYPRAGAGFCQATNGLGANQLLDRDSCGRFSV